MLSKSGIQTLLEKVCSSPLDGREVYWVALGQGWFTISRLRLVGRELSAGVPIKFTNKLP